MAVKSSPPTATTRTALKATAGAHLHLEASGASLKNMVAVLRHLEDTAEANRTAAAMRTNMASGGSSMAVVARRAGMDAGTRFGCEHLGTLLAKHAGGLLP